jgi:hypothetical protein
LLSDLQYEHLVCMRFFPLDRVRKYTRILRDNRVLAPDSTRVVFAASYNFIRLMYYGEGRGARAKGGEGLGGSRFCVVAFIFLPVSPYL